MKTGPVGARSSFVAGAEGMEVSIGAPGASLKEDALLLLSCDSAWTFSAAVFSASSVSAVEAGTGWTASVDAMLIIKSRNWGKIKT